MSAGSGLRLPLPAFHCNIALLSKLAGIEEREWWKSGHFLASV